MSDPYPILLEAPLGAVPKRMLGLIPARRPLGELPAQLPGTVLVFNVASTWVEARGRLTGTETFVVDATSVSVVQARTQAVEVRLPISSASPADDFTILCRFTCRVTSVELAAEQGPIDVSTVLGNFLREDRRLPTLGQETDVEEVHQLRIKVDARIRAYCHEASPPIPGMEVSLSSVEVLTPDDLRTHKIAMRGAAWARELAKLLAEHEIADAQDLAARFNQPEYIAALAVIRDKVDLGKLVVDAYTDRSTKDANILELLKLLEKNGQLDRLPIDGRLLVNRLMERLAGTSASGEDGPPAAIPAESMLTIDTEALKSIDARKRTAEGERFVVDSHTD